MTDSTGWEAVGYGLGGGFEKDRTEREKIQALDAAKANLQYDPSSKTYNPMPGSDLDLVKTQNQMLQQQLAEVQKTVTTSKQWDTIVDSVQSNNFDSFNKLINEDPNLNKIFKQNEGVHAVRQFDPTNKGHIAAMAKGGFNTAVLEYIQSGKATPEEITQIGNAYPIIEKQDGSFDPTSLEDFLAKTNLIKSSTRSAEMKTVLDAIAMGKQAVIGVTDAAYKATLGSMQAKTKLETSVSNKSAQVNDIMSKAMATGKPEEVMKALQLTDPATYLKNTRGSSGRMDSYTQALTAFMAGNPNATAEEYQDFNADFAEQAVAGKGHVAENKDLGSLTGSRKTAESLFTSSAPQDTKTWMTSARTAQDTIMTDLDEKEKGQAMDVSKALYANHNTASLVEGMLKGQVPKVDKDIIQGSIDWVRSKVGVENAQTLQNVDFNTRSGMLLAGYIKEMSGTAASDAEVSRLLSNLLGGNLTDETYIKQSMKSFANFLRTKNNNMAKPFINTLPYDIGKTTNLKPKSGGTQVQPGNKASVTNPSSSYYLAPPKTGTQSHKPTKQGGKPSAADFWR